MIHRVVFAFLLLVVLICPVLADQVPPPSIAWRTVGSQSNLPPPSQPIDFVGAIGDLFVGSSGDPARSLQVMHVAPGAYTASFADFGEAAPLIAGPIPAVQDTWTAFDLPVEWVYEADNLVTGQPFAEMGQTFKSTGDELAKVSFLVASGEDALEVTVRKAGPGGERIGPAVVVNAGKGWGTAQWQPGDVPLQIGETYYIGIKSKSGKPFTPGLHSTGDAYPGGTAFFDGAAEPASDLGLLISLQRDDAIRSQIMFANNADGWVLHSNGVYFRARSSNLRAAFAKVRVKDAPESISCTFKVSRVNGDGTLSPVGLQKRCQSAGKDADGYIVAALWGWDELPLQPPGVYYLEIEPRWIGLDGPAPKADYLVSLYGEKNPGANPVIYNQKITQATPTSVHIAWEGTGNSIVRVNYGITPDKLALSVAVPKGATEADIHPISPGTIFYFKIAAQTEAGGRFETPVYVTRTPDANNNPIKEPPLPAVPNENFIPLAQIDRLAQPPLPEVHEIAEVALQNPEFKDDASGWQTEDAASDKVFYQQVPVKKGSLYMLAASVDTGAGDGKQIRLVCDPRGATQFAGANSTQYFRTGGKLLQFAELWQAGSDTISVGAAVSGLNDPAKIADVVKKARLVEVKEKKPSFWKRWGREIK